MMTWVSAILTILKLADTLVAWLRDKQQLDAGADRQIAQASASILSKTKAAKEVLQSVMGMTEDEVDKTLKGLEP